MKTILIRLESCTVCNRTQFSKQARVSLLTISKISEKGLIPTGSRIQTLIEIIQSSANKFLYLSLVVWLRFYLDPNEQLPQTTPRQASSFLPENKINQKRNDDCGGGGCGQTPPGIDHILASTLGGTVHQCIVGQFHWVLPVPPKHFVHSQFLSGYLAYPSCENSERVYACQVGRRRIMTRVRDDKFNESAQFSHVQKRRVSG